MCCIVEIALTVMGIIALVKQEVQIIPGRTTSGTPAIIIGLVLLSTLPLVFAIGFLIGFIMAQNGGIQPGQEIWLALVDVGGVLLTLGISVIIALMSEDGGSSPRRKKGKTKRKRRLPTYDDELEDDEM